MNSHGLIVWGLLLVIVGLGIYIWFLLGRIEQRKQYGERKDRELNAAFERIDELKKGSAG